MGRKRSRVDKESVTRLGKEFFKYVTEQHADWAKTDYTKERLRQTFKEEYKPWLLTKQHGSKPAYSFATMMFHLKIQRRLKYSHGLVTFHEETGYATIDQNRPSYNRTEHEPSSRQNQYPIRCDVCPGVLLNSESQQRDHTKGAPHRLVLTRKQFKEDSEQHIKTKFGISVTPMGDSKMENGIVSVLLKPDSKGQVSLVIEYCGSNPITLMMLAVLTLDDRVRIRDAENISNKRNSSLIFNAGQTYIIHVSCQAEDFGQIKAPLAFAFKMHNGQIFHVFRTVIFTIGGDDREDLLPSAPYKGHSKLALTPFTKDVVDGVKPSFYGSNSLQQTKPEDYYIPNDISSKLNVLNISDDFKEQLSVGNYSNKFHLLTYAEEQQMKVDIRRYDKKGVEMNKDQQNSSLLCLNVPGLAENRPSVLRGDHLFAKPSDEGNSKAYKGYIHQVREEVVVLGFNQRLVSTYVRGMKYDIQFTFNRFSLRLQHHAVDLFNMIEHGPVLFPDESSFPATTADLTSLQRKFFDRKLEENEQQKLAIYHIMKGSSLPAPYLIFGPPGTGKTMTIVEAMKQVYSASTKNYILACAPSNSAADLMAKRLLNCTRGGTGPVAKSTLLRMCAASRSWDSVDPELKMHKECLNYDLNHAVLPSKELIQTKRIIVTTMVTAGRLVLNTDSPNFKGHFTHIFLDESGHAVEPEAIIPIAGLLPVDGQLVLAGDPKQLGPVLRSPVSKAHGLELSLLERLMTTGKVYQRGSNGQYNERVMTKLLKNYRSHPVILDQSNSMFYDNELEACADELVRNSLNDFEDLPRKGFPIIFHGIEGRDDREENSPSFFNIAEAECVIKYVHTLLEMRRGKNIKQLDIGIISPYRKQVQKIQKLLRKKKWNDIKVGSVEEFQGQERLIIIISTVRSTREDFLKLDQDFKLGFLKNPKRFNVAVTRAKALLICIGNPFMLRKDEHWNGFLEFCRNNGAYKGCPYSPDDIENEIEDLNSKLESLYLNQPSVDRDDVIAVSDPEWNVHE